MLRAFAVSALVGVLVLPGSARQAPALDSLLQRIGQIVEAYDGQALIVTEDATETQAPDIGLLRDRAARSVQPYSASAAEMLRVRRRLVSDLVVFPAQAFTAWLQFRVVRTVDGTALSSLTAGDAGALPLHDLVERLVADNGAADQHHVGFLPRTANGPLVALQFLHPLNHSRSRFRLAGTDRIAGVRASVVEFQEIERPSLVRHRGFDLPATGRVWFDVEAGRIVRTEWQSQVDTVDLLIVVDFGRTDAAGWQPVSMRERYRRPGSVSRIDGEVRYTAHQVRILEGIGTEGVHLDVEPATDTPVAAARDSRVPVEVPAPAPDVARVIERAQAYIDAWYRDAAVIMFDEQYTQSLVERPYEAGRRTPVESHSRRDLRSEMLMVSLPGISGSETFRDITTVDGRLIRDRDSRFERLVKGPASELRLTAARLASEGARFNLGSVFRNINLPTIPLTFLNRDTAGRSAFRKTGEDRIAGRRAWVIAFEELQRPTVIQGEKSVDRPASGRFWIDVETGLVLRTELRLDSASLRANIRVDWAVVPRLNVWLPFEMREHYVANEGLSNQQDITGHATYSNFRRFETGARIIG